MRSNHRAHDAAIQLVDRDFERYLEHLEQINDPDMDDDTFDREVRLLSALAYFSAQGDLMQGSVAA
jgi:hypothetical protein